MYTDDELLEEQMQADADLEKAEERRRRREWQEEYDDDLGRGYGISEKDF